MSLRGGAGVQHRGDARIPMPDLWNNKTELKVERVRLTARVSLEAYELVAETQRRHRTTTGRVLPLWKVIDDAIRAYATTKPT